MRNYQKALEELKAASQLVPHEAAVHHELGKIHREMGDVSKALRCSDTALALDPRTTLIKADLDRLHKSETSCDVDASIDF
eukprot:TRINITY_DN2163_c0_g1_i2.p1 TRINITY_DN2163_c0_g1~~TRINITY_DN2163_c0_g1_i2.p1  ORF type:complete len:81 (+),score=12.59 TRINITY_DN2163_c0_g1_i2:702-944(+)